MKFRYQAKNQEGELQTGFVEAPSKEGAMNVLAGHSLFILSIEPAEKLHWYDRAASFFGRVRRKDMVLFTRQLAVLLEARLPLTKALQTLHDQITQPVLKEALLQIIEDVDAGLAFSQALERQSDVFSDFFVSMVRASEATGNLNEAVSFLADYTEKEGVLASKALGAMLYPAILIGLFTIVAGILITVVFPQLGPVFEGAGVQLPWYTKTLLGSGTFLSHWWFAVVGVIGVLVLSLLNYAGTEEGKAFFDDLKIQLPLVRRVYIPLTVTRFANATSILLRGGIPVAQALEIVSHTVDNVLYQDIFHEVSNYVRQGETLSQALGRFSEYFPPLLGQMVVVGETTGRLDEILERVSIYYTRETDQTLNNMVDLIQPLLMVGLGVMVGFLFAALLIPLYQLTSSFH